MLSQVHNLVERDSWENKSTFTQDENSALSIEKKYTSNSYLLVFSYSANRNQ